LRDWGKLSKKDWEKLEDEWLEDEVEEEGDEAFKWKRGANGERRPPERSGPKTEMGFATVNTNVKAEADIIAQRWQALMSSGALKARTYAVENNKLLFVVEGGMQDMLRVKDFALLQPEVIEFEWNSRTFHPDGRKKPKFEL